ncbi:MAG: NAD(P)-binding protein [Parvularculaceae bacterium]|nr:NAD(P)-binding protein [Parvularculaceae bacterium]
MARLKGNIDRRDFLNGMALSTAAGALAPSALFAAQAQRRSLQPPARQGLRGSHPGAFETAHARAWQGKTWPRPDRLTDSLYDLIVIGAGLSGLAAAHLFKERRPDARILILDNHDDFGGHAKRNEFVVDGKLLIGYGGSQSIDTPSSYSPASKAILSALGVDAKKFYTFFDREFYKRRKMRFGVFLDRETFGGTSLTDTPFSFYEESPTEGIARKAIARMNLSAETKSALARLAFGAADLTEDIPAADKLDYLRKTDFETFLRERAKAPEELVTLLRKIPNGYWGMGWDALSTLEAKRWGMPGTAGIELDDDFKNDNAENEEPYIFHFPDGNASLARLLVRKLIPAAAPGETMEDIVLAPFDYSTLDAPQSDIRIRLEATAVDIRHSDTRKSVDVVYVRDGVQHRVRGRHAIMAGYMAMTPYICSELAQSQASAIKSFTKIPLVYANIALRNWRAFEKAQYHSVYCPGSFFESLQLDFPVSMGGYTFSTSSDSPILLQMHTARTAPGQGLDEREQHRAGRRELYALSYDDFERAIVDQLTQMLAPFGFDAERDIAGVTINRWPHGYAYEYNELYDDPSWSPANGPHLAARAPIERISFANSDTSALAYVNGAFDAAVRAVGEQFDIAD